MFLNENADLKRSTEYIDEMSKFFDQIKKHDLHTFKFAFFKEIGSYDLFTEVHKNTLRKEFKTFIKPLNKMKEQGEIALKSERIKLDKFYATQKVNQFLQAKKSIIKIQFEVDQLLSILNYECDLLCPPKNNKNDVVFELYADQIKNEFEHLLSKNDLYTKIKFNKRQDDYKGVFVDPDNKGMSKTPVVNANRLTALAFNAFCRPCSETQIETSVKKTNMNKLQSLASLEGDHLKSKTIKRK